MEVEAALAPPSVRLSTSVRKYALRALKLAPIHSINLELAPSTQYLDPEPSSPPQATETRTQPRLSQLERIRKSVLGLVDLESLERIEHFKFQPWNRELPYQVEISKLSKDEEALAHNQEALED
jgi:hypothetical protein